MIKQQFLKTLFFSLIMLFAITAKAEPFGERIYMQTDKQSYLSGETVWLKLLTTDCEGVPAALSTVAYVELSDADGARRRFMVGMHEGVGGGWLELPLDLPTGYYRLCAYTAYMKNEGRAAAFEKAIAVINPFLPIRLTAGMGEAPKDTLQPCAQAVHCALRLDKSLYARRERGTVSLSGWPADVVSLSLSIHAGEPFENSASLPAWKEGLSRRRGATEPDIRFLPECEGHIVSGRLVSTESGWAADGAAGVSPFLAVSGEAIRLFGGNVSADGTVRFVTKGINGRSDVITTVMDPSGQTKYRVDLDVPFLPHEPAEPVELLIPERYEAELQLRSVAVQAMRAYWGDSLRRPGGEPLPAFRWKPDESYRLDHYTRFSTMEETIVEIIPALRFRQTDGKRILSIYTDESGYNSGATLVLLDGMPMSDYEDIFAYNPALVQRVDVYKSPFIFSGSYYSGIVHFLTAKHDIPDYKMNASTQILRYELPQLPRLFYAPDYSQEAYRSGYTLPDLRHTLLWLPQIDVQGAASTDIPFFTSDYAGTFVVELEGITRRGEVLTGRATFTVE